MSNKIVAFDRTDVLGVYAVQEVLEKLILPWEPDGHHPSGFTRRNGLGSIVGNVSADLGGYADSHRPEKHGWGYRSCPPGQGSCTSGIEKTLAGAQAKVEFFLTRNFPDLELLDDPDEK